MNDAFAQIFFSLIGRVCLFLKIRSKEKRLKYLDEEFGNSYAAAGATLFWQLIAFILLLAFIVMLAAALYGFLKHNLNLF